MYFTDVGFTTAAKMADIDPNAQQFTQIWGLEIKIPDLLQARSEVLTLRRFWQNMIHASPKNDTSRSGNIACCTSFPVWYMNFGEYFYSCISRPCIFNKMV